MTKKLMIISGDLANAGLLDDQKQMTANVIGGVHNSHNIIIYTSKSNCGAYGQEVECSCGAYWANQVHGCHTCQRAEEFLGSDSRELPKMMTGEYEWEGANNLP